MYYLRRALHNMQYTEYPIMNILPAYKLEMTLQH